MTDTQKAQVREGILITLAKRPVMRNGQRLGSSAQFIARELRELGVDVDTVNTELNVLAMGGMVESKPGNALAPGVDPFWFITLAGLNHCEANHLI